MDADALEGKVAIVTGGGKGIGRAIALELAGRGVRVLVTGRDERALGETVGESGARRRTGPSPRGRRAETTAQASTSRRSGARALGPPRHRRGQRRADGHDPHGRRRGGRLWRGRSSRRTSSAPTSCSTPAVAVMSGAGRLVAISSVLGKFGVAGQAAYCASKAGLHGLVRAVGGGGRASGASPATPSARAGSTPRWPGRGSGTLAGRQGKSYEEARRAAAEATPIAPLRRARGGGELVAYLCSPAAAAITGQALSICGGATAFAG